MIPSVVRRPRRALLVAALGLGLLASALPSHDAQAMLSGCSTDPVVLLSNGVQLDLSATMQDSSSDVQRVTFAVHAPLGTHVLIYTPGVLGPKEVLQFYGDNTEGSYDMYTTATTYTPGISVTAHTEFLGTTILKTNLTLASVSGLSGQALHEHVVL